MTIEYTIFDDRVVLIYNGADLRALDLVPHMHKVELVVEQI